MTATDEMDCVLVEMMCEVLENSREGGMRHSEIVAAVLDRGYNTREDEESTSSKIHATLQELVRQGIFVKSETDRVRRYLSLVQLD